MNRRTLKKSTLLLVCLLTSHALVGCIDLEGMLGGLISPLMDKFGSVADNANTLIDGYKQGVDVNATITPTAPSATPASTDQPVAVASALPAADN